MKQLLLLLPLLLLTPLTSAAPLIKGAREEVYRQVDDIKLKAYILGESDAKKPKPAIIFFFGGGWNGGKVQQFEKQANHLAQRGMIAILADYRVRSRHKVKPVECAKDAKACLAWVRENSERLGIIPQKICAAGGSAGGHLAAATGTLPGLGSEERPNAMILFNPVAQLADWGEWTKKRYAEDRDLGIEAIKLCPTNNAGKHSAPTIIFHGTADTTVPYHTVEALEAALKKADQPVQLVPYKGRGHGFFNKGKDFTDTLEKSDEFLVELGWIPKK